MATKTKKAPPQPAAKKKGKGGKPKPPKKAGNASEPIAVQPAPKPERTREQTQDLVDRLVRENGCNLLNRADCNELLGSFGLVRGDVTEAMVEHGDRKAREFLRQMTRDHNANGKRAFNVVLAGDPEFDASVRAPATPSASSNGTATEQAPATPKKARAQRERKKRSGMSCIDAAAKMLEDNGGSMTAIELAKQMQDSGYWSTNGLTPHATVAARIYVDIQNNGTESRFVKVEKGVFALRK